MENFGKVLLFDLIRKKKIDKKNRTFSFQLKQNKKNSLIYQNISKNLKNFLTNRYKFSNINNSQMNTSNHRKKHGDRFLKFLKKNFKKSFFNKEVLEIGCGSGYILEILKKRGARVSGVEPGMKYKNQRLNIRNDFFLNIKYEKKFDVVINNAVLEHQFNLEVFLKKIYDILKHNGMCFLCVPNYEVLLTVGDPTLINHEHVSYFTKHSLKNVFQKIGFNNTKTFSDNYGNLYGLGYKGKKNKKFNKNILSFKKYDLKNYKIKFGKCIQNIEKWTQSQKRENDKLGLYGATSAISTIFSKVKFTKKNLYIFDNDNDKQNKYLYSFPNIIMSPKKITKMNIKKILILPIFYEKEIKNYLVKSINFKKKDIFRLSQFFPK